MFNWLRNRPMWSKQVGTETWWDFSESRKEKGLPPRYHDYDTALKALRAYHYFKQHPNRSFDAEMETSYKERKPLITGYKIKLPKIKE